jgi:hypothetical protein
MKTKQFNRLSVNEKAVLVAEDVLLQISAKRYTPKRGSYLIVRGGYNFRGSIKDNFDTIQECQVCALGSMLMSSTHLGNLLTTEDLHHAPSSWEMRRSEKVTQLFNSIFTNKQLLMIETAFEGYSRFNQKTLTQIKTDYKKNFIYDEPNARYSKEKLTFDETLACEMFNRKYKDSEKRLKAICRNIIKNNGVFIP